MVTCDELGKNIVGVSEGKGKSLRGYGRRQSREWGRDEAERKWRSRGQGDGRKEEVNQWGR